MPARVVDYRSDTITQPTDEMRAAMAAAKVGDDVYGEDPTVNELQAVAAKTLGKEAALFVPSGTMANEIAIGVHAPRGTEILADRESHVTLYENGAPAALWGVTVRTIASTRGVFGPRQVAEAVRDASDVHVPRTSLLCIENTHNLAGGTVWTPAQTSAVGKVAREHGLRVHLDGARLWNSAVAQDVTPASLAAPADSVFVALSKGLSAPIGSLVAGSREFVAEATRVRKMLGGGMRQAGVIAAAGIVALTKMQARLKEDHANCRRLATGLSRVPGFGVDLEAVQTNILFVDVAGTGLAGPEVERRLAAKGVRASALDDQRVRFVTHRHVSKEDVDWTLGVVEDVLRKGKKVAARSR